MCIVGKHHNPSRKSISRVSSCAVYSPSRCIARKVRCRRITQRLESPFCTGYWVNCSSSIWLERFLTFAVVAGHPRGSVATHDEHAHRSAHVRYSCDKGAHPTPTVGLPGISSRPRVPLQLRVNPTATPRAGSGGGTGRRVGGSKPVGFQVRGPGRDRVSVAAQRGAGHGNR